MDTAALRAELTDFYWNHIDDRAAAFRDRVFPLLDQRWQPDMTACQRKAMQYETIAERCECVLFHQSPFYYELGAMQHLCDGAGDFHGVLHAGGWNYARFSHLFWDQDPALARVRNKQGENLLYLICGPYADTRQHFYYNCKPIFSGGLKSLCDAACAQLETPRPESEKDFLRAAVRGLLSLKAISEKFARAAEERLKSASDAEERARLERIAEAAAYAPWNAPRTFYEALNTLAFMAGRDLNRLSGELSKLAAYVETRPEITEDDVREIVSPSLEYNVFELLNRLLEGNLGEAEKMVANLLQNGQNPVGILAMLTRQLRQLTHMRLALDAGKPVLTVQEALKLHPYAARQLARQAKMRPAEMLHALFEEAIEYDFQIKSGKLRDREALGALMIKIADSGLAKRGN